jgi:hypothetical protein
MASLDDFALLSIDSSRAQTRPKSANYQIEMVRYRFSFEINFEKFLYFKSMMIKLGCHVYNQLILLMIAVSDLHQKLLIDVFVLLNDQNHQ